MARKPTQPLSTRVALSYMAQGYQLWRRAGLDGIFWLKMKGRKGEKPISNTTGISLITKKLVREVKSKWSKEDSAWIISHELTEKGKAALDTQPDET